MLISIVIPVFNEAGAIPELMKKLESGLSFEFPDDYEIIIVNDGSTDKTEELLETLSEKSSSNLRVEFSNSRLKTFTLALLRLK